MTITYVGHSCFKLKGKRGTILMDPFSYKVGFAFPNTSADIVTVSHDHFDHNNSASVTGTARRPQPFLISQAGEYEVGGISVFGTATYHDQDQGKSRGGNVVFTALIDEVRVCHLGDLGHLLTEQQVEDIGGADVLLCPVGGEFTIDAPTALKVIHQLEPAIVIPMHFQTPQHAPEFGKLQTLSDFTQEYGTEPQPLTKLEVTSSQLPEETELVVLSQHLSGG